MQKKILVTLLALCMLLTVLPFALTAGAADGECIEIDTADELLMLMNQQEGYSWSADYMLTADIDLTKKTVDLSQAPIGNATTVFSGTFDGDNYTISSINITSESTDVGLFGMAKDATICNLTIQGSISGGNYTGGIVGFGQNLSITNCVNECTVAGGKYVGGIIGALGGSEASVRNATASATITGCRNKGAISGGQYVGGIVAYTRTTDTVMVFECMNERTVTATTAQSDVGGIAGVAWGVSNDDYSGNVIVSDCINTGAVSGNKTNMGGIVGRTYQTTCVQYCYNAGSTTWTAEADQKNIDAIVGNIASTTTITGNYYTAGTADTDCGGTNVTTENIGVASSYGDATNGALNTNRAWFFSEEGPVLKCFATVTEIADADGLYALMGKEINGYYRLTDNIDLSELAEGTIQSPITSFSGIFEGNGNTISGINIAGTADGVGLFGTAKNAEIYDLTLIGTVDGGDYSKVGGLIGNGTLASGEFLYVSNCTNKCTVTGYTYVGGIVGCIGTGNNASAGTATITDCRNVGDVTGNCSTAKTYVGGISGYVRGSSATTHVVTECMNSAYVNAKYQDVGGILGIAYGVTVKDCINIGVIDADKSNAGGIIGRSASTNYIQYNFNSGVTISADADADLAHAILGSKGGTINSQVNDVTTNYYTNGGEETSTEYGTYVDPEVRANADTYTDWSADIWTFTSAGPRLTPYVIEINTADEFVALAKNSNIWDEGNFYILTADIDLKDVTDQTPIGNSTTPFVGGFDGAGHTISGIKLTGTGNSVGLFGAVKNAEIYNLTVNGEVNGVKYVGGIVGDGNLVSGEFLYISGCTNACTVSGTQHVGGIVGIIGRAGNGNSSKGVATITGCRNTGSVSATNQVGGIAGYIYGVSADTHTITECMNSGAISGTLSSGNTDVGGILGIAWKANVTDCINAGEISGSSKCIGGIVGRGNEAYDVQRCYNSGSTTGSSSVGAIIGYDPKSCISTDDNNYYSAGTDNSKGTLISENLGDATQYSGLNDSDAWVITCEGPKLTCFGVKILTKVVETAANTVTVDLYAKSVTPFWGTQFTVTAPQGYTLTDVEPVTTLSDGLTFTAVANDDGTYNQAHKMALCVLPEDSDELTNVTLATATKVATLTFTVYPIAEENTITVESTAAYQKDDTVIAYHGVDATVTHTFTEDTTTTYGHGVTLASEYLLEYTVAQDDTIENPYMVFTSTNADGVETKTIVTPYEYKSKWRFSAPGIAAKNMGDTITGTLCYTKDGKLYKATTDEYNIVDYYTKMYAKYKDDTTYTAFCNLLNAMLNYGAAAQTYFEYDTENSVGTSLPDGYVATDAVATEKTDRGTETGETIKYSAYGSTAVLNQRIELVVSFTLNTGATAIDASELVFKGEYKDVYDTTRTFTISGKDFVVDTTTNAITVYIDQIAAKDLRQMVTGALWQGDTQVSQSVTTSFECYATIAAEAEKDICAAILAYVDAAKTYFTQAN